jgi:hypothetical protein
MLRDKLSKNLAASCLLAVYVSSVIKKVFLTLPFYRDVLSFEQILREFLKPELSRLES